MDKTLANLAKFESRNITFIDPDGAWPIVWERACGMHVWDVKGRRYLDLTAAFGVAAAGHANPRVVRAGQRQMARLLHAMGDVHPPRVKGELVRKLSELTFERWSKGRAHGRTILCNSGFEAVESALKTALLATKRPGVISFEGGYHGLGYGALNATHRPYFSKPFRGQLRGFGKALPWGCEEIRSVAKTGKYGAVLVEPIQARAGERLPPPGFLKMLRAACDEFGMLLILDEIYTGFGRTGKWFACEHFDVVPDLICVGKAMTGGFPMSACIGRAEVMDCAWPPSPGEALHTSTFLGHPVGCAMALAQVEEIKKLVPLSARRGEYLLKQLRGMKAGKYKIEARGLGLMVGVEIDAPGAEVFAIVKRLLRRGFIFLPSGERSNVISFTPPLNISEAQIGQSVRALEEELSR